MPLHTSVRRKLLLPSHLPPKSRQVPTTRPQKKALKLSQNPPPEQGTEESGGDTVAQQHRGGAVAAAGGREAVHHGPGLVQGRYGTAELAA